jgi:multicomponent Na+:H+ antiporter subunit D
MNWPTAPFLLPMVTALITLFWGRPGVARRWLVSVSLVAQLAVGVGLVMATQPGRILVLGLGAWPAELGIVLVVDLLTAVMVTLTALVALVAQVYGFIETRWSSSHPLRIPLIQFLLTGIQLTYCTGDLFNLFVAFEIMLIASYALLTLEADDWDIKQAFPYVAVNLFGSALFICGCGLVYSLFGTLNFGGIARRVLEMERDGVVALVALLLLLVFGIKAGLFPLHLWLPNSYPTLPIPLLALFGGVLTKVGVYVIIRMLGTVLPHDLGILHDWLGGFALVTAVVGGVGAISRPFIRGILSFHIVSQVGLMLLAVSFMTPLGLASALMILWHNLVVKSSLFLIGGTAALLNRSDDLSRMGGLWSRVPWLGVLFLVQALSLAGIPPLSGFWGKYLVVRAGLEAGEYVLVAGSIGVSVLTLFSMVKIWLATFWSEPDGVVVRTNDPRWRSMAGVIAVLALVSLGMGLGAEGFSRLALEAANRVLDQEGYVRAVEQFLGKTGGVTP